MALNGTAEVVTSDEQRLIVDWVGSNCLSTFTPNPLGPHRYYRPLDGCPDSIAQVAAAIRNRIVSEHAFLGDPAVISEPYIGDYIGCVLHTGFIHAHVDDLSEKAHPDMCHVRACAYVQLPTTGGLPIVRGTVVDAKERSYVIIMAGRALHECQPVQGPRDRVTLSFGFMVPLGVEMLRLAS